MARRRSYFALPPRPGWSYQLGEGSALHQYMAALVLIFVGMTIYVTFLLPGIESLQCGEAWANEYKTWEDPTGNNKAGDPPECDDGHLPTVYSNLSKFLPFLVFLPLLIMIIRPAGNPSSFASMLLALLVRELVPGDSTIDWIIMAIGVVGAVIPLPMGGLLAALAHAGALALWPMFVLAYIASAQAAGTAVSGAVDWVFEFTVWIALFGILTLVPLRWRADNDRSGI